MKERICSLEQILAFKSSPCIGRTLSFREPKRKALKFISFLFKKDWEKIDLLVSALVYGNSAMEQFFLFPNSAIENNDGITQHALMAIQKSRNSD